MARPLLANQKAEIFWTTSALRVQWRRIFSKFFLSDDDDDDDDHDDDHDHEDEDDDDGLIDWLIDWVHILALVQNWYQYQYEAKMVPKN